MVRAPVFVACAELPTHCTSAKAPEPLGSRGDSAGAVGNPRVQASGFRVQGLGFRALGFSVLGL